MAEIRHKSFIYRFAMRWLVSALGLWIAAGIFSGSISYDGGAGVVLIGGLVLAIVNTLLKPLLVILSLPAILLSLGLFMIVVNGATVALADYLYEPLQITSFWVEILAGMIIGLVNYLVTTILEDK